MFNSWFCITFNCIPYFWKFKLVRVSSLVGRYFYSVFMVKSLKLCFPLMSRTIIYFHAYILLDFPITYRNASVLYQSECVCLHKTVNMVVFSRIFLRKFRLIDWWNPGGGRPVSLTVYVKVSFPLITFSLVNGFTSYSHTLLLRSRPLPFRYTWHLTFFFNNLIILR